MLCGLCLSHGGQSRTTREQAVVFVLFCFVFRFFLVLRFVSTERYFFFHAVLFSYAL